MHDVIVVGGRCAGASVAMLLARRGHKVLLLDRDDFPSDMPVSTHLVWQAGTAKLKEWGLLDRLRATGCAAMEEINLDLGPFSLSGKPKPAGDVTECYGPRRFVLDKLLVDEACAAGAELRQGSVTDLLIEDGRVTGVRYADAAGAPVEAKARIVIGADGANSTVARLAGAAAYNERPQLAGNIYAYFRGLKLDGLEFIARPGRMFYAWRTNEDLCVAGVCCRHEDFRALSQDPETSVFAELAEQAPAFHARLRGAQREGAWLKASNRSFFRKAFGPGWALVGDAGLTMDPITAAGISNAFRDAQFLADAAHEGLSGAVPMEAALARYEAQRDEASGPIYEFTCETAKLDPPPQSFVDLLVAMHGNARAIADYFGVFAQTERVQDFFAPEKLAGIMAAASSPAAA